ncbi:hypothetical protein DHEL01_v200274 [Diaporthe helianthi]|uniref:Uncharacterized protein n=1 Tax=Diaporthe helianthi TaxID=158607 RepID=A0A2P5IFS1_DIAHE|nr:hypothetical protein DHEL01_v200274 [Diaporthe helianthi]
MVFEQLLSCSGCNSAVLIKDPSTSHSMVKEPDLVGIAIYHEPREVCTSTSWLDVFPFAANHEPSYSSPNSRHGGAEQEGISRQFVCMEKCATPEARREISREWGLQWWGFEQHFETIATWTGSHLGQCPCQCHSTKRQVEDPRPGRKDAACVHDEAPFEGDDCASVTTTTALVGGQESGRRPVKPRVRSTRRGDDEFPPGWPEDGRERARSEEIRHTELFILEWRERCRREQVRRVSAR